MTLSEFVNVLNKHLGYLIDKSESTSRKSNALVLKGFLLNFVSPDAPEDSSAQDFNPLSQSDDFLGRIYNGTATLPYDDANSILNRLDAGAFNDFAKTKPTKETLEALKKDLKAYHQKLDINDYEYSLVQILKKILIDIVEKNENDRLKDYATNGLLKEVNFECPLKKKHNKTINLIKNRKKSINGKSNLIPNYMTLRIYPSGLTKDQKKDFDAIKKEPSNLDDDSNKICVCPACYKEYMLNPNVDDYSYILKVKENLAKTVETGKITSSVIIENQINDILGRLCNLDPSEIEAKLRMKPLSIANKILPKNIDLNTKVSQNIEYYFYIQKLFSSLDEKRSVFNIIAKEVETCFLKLEAYDNDQNYIFDALVDWILEKSGLNKSTYRCASEKVVSFFIQNCEVFHEISKQSNCL